MELTNKSNNLGEQTMRDNGIGSITEFFEDIENIFLITIDAFRYRTPGFEDRTITPNLNKLADDGINFTHTFSQGPYTPGSFLGLFSSKYPEEYGEQSNVQSTIFNYRDERPIISEILKSEGFSNYAIITNQFLRSSFGYNRGFDFFDESDLIRLTNYNDIKFDRLYKWLNIWGYLKNYFLLNRLPELDCKQVNKKVLKLFQRKISKTSEPFFLWVHYMDTHGPYWPPKKYRKYFIRGKMKKEEKELADTAMKRALKKNEDNFISEKLTYLAYRIQRYKLISRAIGNGLLSNREIMKRLRDYYRAALFYTDEQIYNLIMQLKKRNYLENTLIIITSDHGELFGEHGMFSHPQELYEELIHIPLIFYHPNKKINIKFEYEKQVRHIDILPTILEVLNINNNNFCFSGKSLLPQVKNYKLSEDLPVFSEAFSEKEKSFLFSLRYKGYKYIHRIGKMEDELYNLQDDPKEENNLIDKDLSVKRVLEKMMEEHLENYNLGNKKQGAEDKIENDFLLRKKLEDLGYI